MTLTADKLRDLLLYEPTTGLFRWLRTVQGYRGEIGDVAGTRRPSGHWLISIGGRRYYAHRLAWLYVHGRWPENEIDHINGDVGDNRLSNLREATRHQNMANSGPSKRSKTGFRGVTQIGPKLWRAAFRGTHLGVSNTPEEAASVYASVAKAKYGEFVREDERRIELDPDSFETRRRLGLVRLRERRRLRTAFSDRSGGGG